MKAWLIILTLFAALVVVVFCTFSQSIVFRVAGSTSDIADGPS